MATLFVTDMTCSCWFMSEMHCIMSKALNGIDLTGTMYLNKGRFLSLLCDKHKRKWILPFNHAHATQKLFGVRFCVKIREQRRHIVGKQVINAQQVQRQSLHPSLIQVLKHVVRNGCDGITAATNGLRVRQRADAS